MPIILSKPVELSHEWGLKIFKYQKPEFYARLFDDTEEDPFEVPSDRTKVDVIRKPLPGAPKSYILWEIKSACMFYSLTSDFPFVDEKVAADSFNDEILLSLKYKDRIKCYQNVIMNNVKEKGKTWCKLSYKVFW